MQSNTPLLPPATLWENLFKSNPNFMVVISADYRFEAVNQQASEKIYQVTGKKVSVGESIKPLFALFSTPDFENNLSKAFAGVSVSNIEHCLKSQKGPEKCLKATFFPVVIENNSVSSVCISAETSKPTKSRLPEHFTSQKAMLESLSEMGLYLDASGIILDYWAKEDNLLLVKSWRLLGKNILEVLPSALATLIQESLEKTPAKQEFEYKFESDTYFAVNIAFGERKEALVIIRDITESKRIAKTLQQTEARFQAFMENSPFGAWFVDSDSRILYMNKAQARLKNLDIDSVIGRKGIELVSPQAAQRFLETLKKVCDEGKPIELLETMPLPDGTTGRGFTLFFPVPDPTGLQLIGGIEIDLTDRLRHDEALLLSEQRYRTLVKNFPNGVVVLFDKDLKHILAEGKDFLDHKIDPEMVVGKHLRETMPPTVFAKIEPYLQAALDGKESVFEFDYDKDHCFQLYTIPIKNNEGAVVYGMLMSQEITERKKAEALLERYRLLSQNTIDIILFIKQDGTILEANQAAVAAYGYSVEELENLNIRDLRTPDTLGTVTTQMQKAIAEGLIFESFHRRKDGSIFPVEVSSRGIVLDGESVILSVIRDNTERKIAKDELRRSEELYRTLLRNLPGSTVVVFDQDLRHIVAKGTSLPGIDIPSDLLEGKTLYEALPPTVTAELLPYYKLALSGVEDSFELAYFGRSYLVRVAPLRLGQNEINAGMLLATDITALKKTEQALRESEQLLKTVVNNANVLLVATDNAGIITLLEGKILEKVGLQPGQNVGKPFVDLPGIPPGAKEYLTQALEGKSVTHIFENGPLAFETWYTPIVSSKNVITGTTSLSIDISERVQSQKALEESENRYRSVISNIKEVVFQTDAAGLWIFLNPAWTEVTGFTIEESIGQNFLDYVHPDDRERNMALFVPLIERKKDYCRHQVRYLTSDDNYRWIEVFARLTLDENDNIIGTSGTLRDITEQRRAEEALQYRLDFEQIIASISTNFINLSAEDITSEINQALAKIGHFSGADRSYIFLFSQDDSLMSNTHEWCSEGTEPQISFLQDLPINDFAWAVGKLQRFEVVHIPDLNLIPAEGQLVKEILEMQSIKSIVLVPMVYEKKLYGYLGFDAVNSNKTWNKDDIQLLTFVGQVFTNALKRKQTEQALVEQRDFAQLVVNTMGQGLTVIGSDARFQFVNPAYANMIGYEVDEIIGLHPRDLTHPDDKKILQEQFKVRLSDQTSTYDTRLVHRDGSDVNVTITGVPIWRDNTFKGVIATITNITLRKRGEELLQQSEARLRSLVSNVPLIQFILDETGIITFAEGLGFAVLGFTPSHIIGRSIFKDFASSTSSIKQALSGEKVNFIAPIRSRSFEVWLTPVIALDGKLTSVIGVALDVSDRLQAEKEVLQAFEREKELNSLKSRFISMASHEFRTPLTTILSSSELLENYGHKWTKERNLELFGRIRQSVKNMTELIDEVLFINRSEVDKIEFKPYNLDLATFSSNLLEEIQLGLGAKHKFDVNIESSLSSAWVDEKLLRQIITNLLTNAIKYSPAASTVHFSLTYEKSNAVFIIRDEGIGIPPDGLEHLFEVFYRAGNVGNIQGTGLGLAIVKKCVEAHNGTIKVESSVGNGTSCEITIPVKVG